MAGISEEEFLKRKKERLAAKSANMTPNTDNGASKAQSQPTHGLVEPEPLVSSPSGKGKIIFIIVAAVTLLIGGTIALVMMNHNKDTIQNSISESKQDAKEQVDGDTGGKGSEVANNESSKDDKNTIKYDCSTLTADQLIASIKDPGNPTDDELYQLSESLQCCDGLKGDNCVFMQVIRMKGTEMEKQFEVYNDVFERKTLFDKMVSSKTALVRTVAYASYYQYLYKLSRKHEEVPQADENILFVKNAIQREQNPKTDIELALFDLVTGMIGLLAEGISHQDCFTLYGLPEVRAHLNSALHHERSDIRDAAKRTCEHGGRAGKQLCNELLKDEKVDHKDYLDSQKERDEMAQGKEAQLAFIRDITYKKQKKPSWLIFKDQQNRFCAVITSSKYQILQETNYCIPFSGKDEDLKDSFAGNRIAETDYPDHKQCKNVKTHSDNTYCNNFYQDFIKMAERENFVKLKELCQSDKSLKDVCKYLE